MTPLPKRSKANPFPSRQQTVGNAVQKNALFLPSQDMAEGLCEVAKHKTPRVLCARWHEMPIMALWAGIVPRRALRLAYFGCRDLLTKARVKRAVLCDEKIFSHGQMAILACESAGLIRFRWGGR